MKTEIKIWSGIGSTPITKRGGAYCDLLIDTEFECNNPDEAKELAIKIKRATPYGSSAHFYMPDYCNQNTRSGWL